MSAFLGWLMGCCALTSRFQSRVVARVVEEERVDRKRSYSRQTADFAKCKMAMNIDDDIDKQVTLSP